MKKKKKKNIPLGSSNPEKAFMKLQNFLVSAHRQNMMKNFKNRHARSLETDSNNLESQLSFCKHRATCRKLRLLISRALKSIFDLDVDSSG